jgi:hypothetical protein
MNTDTSMQLLFKKVEPKTTGKIVNTSQKIVGITI